MNVVNQRFLYLISRQNYVSKSISDKNVVLSMLAKIFKIDAATKQLTARVEAQSFLISALALVLSKQGGVTEMMESAGKAINTIINSVDTDEVLKSDAAILLHELQDLLMMARTVDGAAAEIDQEGLSDITGVSFRDNASGKVPPV